MKPIEEIKKMNDLKVLTLAWEAWEKVNTFFSHEGGVNPHAYEKGFVDGYRTAENKWLNTIDRPLIIKNGDGSWQATADGNNEFFACVPYNDSNHPGKDFFWVRHCRIVDNMGLCVVTDEDYDEPAGWTIDDVAFWQPIPEPPKQ